MASLKQKGDLAEVMVASDLLRRGYKIAIPFGDDSDYDLTLRLTPPKNCQRLHIRHAADYLDPVVRKPALPELDEI